MTDQETTTLATRTQDRIDEAILKSRRIFISDGVDSDLAHEVIRKLWFLEHEDSSKPILLIINSPGGSVDSGFAIWDQIQMLKSPVTTLVTGLAASMGSILSLAAPKGRRFATKRSRIMIHQPMIAGVIKGQATDLEIQAKEMIKTHEEIIKIYMDATGKDYETIKDAIDRDTWLSADEAKEYGLIDEVITSYEMLIKKGHAC